MAKSKLYLLTKVLILISLGVIMIIAMAIILGYAYEDKIKNYSIEQINKNINAKIKVDIIELSFLSHFPNAALDFKNIKIIPNGEDQNAVLIEANHIYLSFDIFNILQGNYLLNNLIIDGAKVNLNVDKNGNHNFHILKSNNEESTNNSNFFVNLSSVKILTSHLLYKNEATKQELSLLINRAKLNGNFAANNFKINLEGENIIEYFINNDRQIIANKFVDLDVIFTAEPNSGIYKLSKGNITYQGIPMDITGSLSLLKNTVNIDAAVNAENIEIQNAINNFPDDSQSSLKEFKPKGLLSINASVKGSLGGRELPHIQLSSDIKKASFYLKKQNISFNDVQMHFDYSNGNNNDLKGSNIQIKNMKFISSIGDFSGQIHVNNLWKPQIKMELASSLKLDKIKTLLAIDTIKTMRGNADLKSWINLSLKYIDSTNSWGLNNISMKHNFVLQNSSFAFNNSQLSYDSITASGLIDNNNIDIKSFVFRANKTLLRGNISISNIPIKEFQKTPQKLNIIGDIKATNITFEQIVAAFPTSQSEDSRFSNDIFLDLNLDILTFDYQHIKASNINGKLIMNNRKLYSNLVSLNAFGGKIISSFVMDGGKQGVFHFLSEGNISGINISNAFAQLDNFGQETITNKNIYGLLHATYNFKTDFDVNWNIVKPSVEMSAELQINNGELKGMTTLNALRDYTRIDDFSNIHFSTLKNTIVIKDEKITIPNMEIRSDKMNIDLYGVHDFDNKYEYHFVVLLSEVLGKHYQQKLESEFGDIENDGYGQTRLFFTMKGKGDKFELKYDRSGLAKKLKGDLIQEKTSLKNALKEEFGLFKTAEEKAKSKSDSLKINAKQKEKQQLKKQEEGKFILEWDDDDG